MVRTLLLCMDISASRDGVMAVPHRDGHKFVADRCVNKLHVKRLEAFGSYHDGYLVDAIMYFSVVYAYSGGCTKEMLRKSRLSYLAEVALGLAGYTRRSKGYSDMASAKDAATLYGEKLQK